MLVADHAYRDSTLNPQTANSVAPIIGFDRLDKDYPFAFKGTVLDVQYFDEQPVTNPATSLPSDSPFAYQRAAQEEEREFLNFLVAGSYVPGTSGAAIEQQVRAWLMRGDAREDDNDYHFPSSTGWSSDDLRDTDPYGYILRAVKHFYDPIGNREFQYKPMCDTYTCLPSINWSLGRTNPLNPPSDTEDTGRRNHFSWQDARNNYWWALTLERIDPGTLTVQGKALASSQERLGRWATTIHDVGHVIHLLQDAAQPQHVRNDGHGPPVVSLLYGTDRFAAAAFEEYTEYRVTRDYGAADSQNFSSGGNPLRMLDQSVPPLNALPSVNVGQANYYPGNGGHVQFSTPVKFFTTRHIETGTDDATVLTRRGLADFANHSFFTAGTLPGFKECQPPGSPTCTPSSSYTYTLPPNDLTSAGYVATLFDGGVHVNSRTVFLGSYAYPITDKVSPNYDATLGELAPYGGRAPLVTKSVWTDVIPDDLRSQYLQTVGYTISYNNMRYEADVMLPRAVGYSAGLIDFFFRGRIQVDAPIDGLFGLVDHSLAHAVDANGYPHCNATVLGAANEPDFCDANQIYGFTKIRLKIRNNTPPIAESGTGTSVPQNMLTTSATPSPTGPRLVAVARYHRNLCYTPLLTGEAVVDYLNAPTENDCAAGNRTNYQEISVSKPLAIDAANLNGASSYAVAFDFSNDPIPINATDLFIQVVYRGQLGDEPDGIAVGMIDVAEPNYLTLWNNSDYAGCNGAWITANGQDGCTYSNNGIGKGISTARICIGQQFVYERLSNGGNGNIFIDKYVRLAALLDKKPASHLFRGNLIVGLSTEMLTPRIDKMISGSSRQALLEVETMANPYVPDAMYTKRGFIGNFRPMPFYLISGADPQPITDIGSSDVGSLTNVGTGVAPNTGGTVRFPNTPPSPVPACQ